MKPFISTNGMIIDGASRIERILHFNTESSQAYRDYVLRHYGVALKKNEFLAGVVQTHVNDDKAFPSQELAQQGDKAASAMHNSIEKPKTSQDNVVMLSGAKHLDSSALPQNDNTPSVMLRAKPETSAQAKHLDSSPKAQNDKDVAL